MIWDPSSPKNGPKTKPGTSETHRGPRGNVPVAYVPGISIWGSIGVLEAAHFRAKKKSPARPEMAPSTRDKPLRCNPAAWEGLGGQPYRRGAPGLRYGANIRTIHPTRAVRRSNSRPLRSLFGPKMRCFQHPYRPPNRGPRYICDSAIAPRSPVGL